MKLSMHGKHLYEYAVIRVVPRVEREEFINIGLIMFSKSARYLRVCFTVQEEKIRLFDPEFDLELLHDNLAAFEKICAGSPEGGPLGALGIAERFRWLTAVRSSSIQTSRPHPGFTENPDSTFDRLFRELVAGH